MSKADLSKQPAQVAAMFDQVSTHYDRTNTVLSMGNATLWRVATTRAVGPRAGETILDVAAGTGTSSASLARNGASHGSPDFDSASITNPNGFAGIDGIFRFRPDGLVERGLVERQTDPHDGRGILVRMTQQGLTRVDAAITRLVDAEAELLRTLAPADQNRLAALLRKLSLDFD